MVWIAMLDASPPPSVSMPEAKKLRSAKVPRGVRTYLRAIARETVDSCRPTSAATSRRVSGRRRLAAEFEEAGLLPHQAAHDLEQGFAARFDVLQQPARFLQAAAQVAASLPAGVADHLFVAAMDGQCAARGLPPAPRARCPAGARSRNRG